MVGALGRLAASLAFATSCLVSGVALAQGPSPTPTDAPSPVPATPPAASSRAHLDLGVGTYFPLDVAVDASLEVPYGILLRGSLGWMPSPYSNTIVDVLGDVGALNSFETDLIKAALQSALVVRIEAGWRPFPKLGLEALVGYTLFTAGGSVTGTDVVDSFLQSKGSSGRFTALTNVGIPLTATLHNIDATLDYRFLLWDDRIVLRASLGYLQCLASSTSVTATPTRPGEQAALTKLNGDLQGFLNPYFTEYVKAPLVGLTVSYRF